MEIDFTSTGHIVGIDLGTTNSLVAFMDLTGPRIIPGADGDKLVPSVVSIVPGGEVVVGNPARELLMTQSERCLMIFRNGANASGDYTVKATFLEPKYMNLNTHPHPYGVFIGGNDMGTPGQTDLYCAAYGNGKFIVRGFGSAPFKMNGFRGDANDAVHKAAGQGQPVSQDVALSVKGSKVECSINGTVVASYDKALLVTGGKLKSTDGTYGLRFAHNTDVMVTGLTMTKN